MADTKKNTPEIRFRGFEKEWEYRRLNELCSRITRKNSNLESKLPLTISSLYGLVDQITYFNNRVASQNITGYYLIKNGEFAYNKSSSDGFPVGSVKRLDFYDKGVLSTLYIVFGIKDESIVSDFLVSYFNTSLWFKEITDRATEGARNHGLLNISANDFLTIKIQKPKSEDEQISISNFFQHLDALISNRQKKLESLKKLKKSCLAKMFPQNGSKVPEIRFKGFEGEWEEKKLGEILQYEQPQKYIVVSTEYSDNYDLPVLTAGQSFILGYTNEKFGIKKASKDNPIIIFDDFTTSTQWVDFDFKVKSSAMKLLTTKEKDEDLFFYFLTLKNINYIVQNHERHWISLFAKMTIMLPQRKEQERIVFFFKELDKLIETKERELEKFQNLKKACLNKMFA